MEKTFAKFSPFFISFLHGQKSGDKILFLGIARPWSRATQCRYNINPPRSACQHAEKQAHHTAPTKDKQERERKMPKQKT
jgi:hypothetical protein